MSKKISRKEALQHLGTLAMAGLVPAGVKAGASKNDHLPDASLLKGTQPNGKPNIVLIIADQLRADACKREGFALDTTPFLDSLAERSTWFNRSYCAAPACVPSRTSMMTGRFPSATRVRSNWNIQDVNYKADLVDVVKANGYTTALIGKNHTYLNRSHFDHWVEYNHLAEMGQVSAEVKKVNDYLESTNFYFDPKPAPIPASMQQPSRIVDDSVKWIGDVSQNNGKPFFLYMSIPEPHNPYQVSEPYYSMFPPHKLPPLQAGGDSLAKKSKKWHVQKQLMEMGYPNYEKNIPRIRSNYYGMLRLIDDQLKRFVGFLEEQKLADNTVIIFVADHGDFVGEYGMIKKGVEAPDCLARIPMIWHGPKITGKKEAHTAHVSNVDIMPTICDMLGAAIPEGVQGRSLWPLLSGKAYPEAEFESIIAQQGFGGLHVTNIQQYDPYTQDGTLTKGRTEFDELNTWSQSGTLRLLRKGDWKLITDMQGDGQLYDLKTDPVEVNNLYGQKEHAQKQAELMHDLLAWELRMQDPLPHPRPTPKRKYGFKRDQRNYWAPYRHDNNIPFKKG
ncbi:MAG: sulfatase-like hydrolase/transferase [Mucilaginibacter sp.]|uniref:sulfatase family protein n=1 Tax=Mucilaginibacter sp. TaxID=1882438 RepID=UPI00319EBE91